MSRIPAILIFTMLAVPQLLAETVVIEWKWRAGDTWRYRVVQEQVQSIRQGNQRVEGRQQQEMVVRYTVAAVSTGGVARLEVAYESFRFELDHPGGERLDYDSTAPPTSTVHAALRPMAKLAGSTLVLQVDRLGRVVHIQGHEALLQAMTGQDSPVLPLPGFDTETLKSQFEPTFRVVPPVPVYPGAAWTRESEQTLPLLGPTRLVSRYTLKEVVDRETETCAHISVIGGLDKTAQASLAPVFRTDGDIVFGLDTGRMLRQVFNMAWVQESPASPEPDVTSFRQEFRQRIEYQIMPNAVAE